MGGGLFGIKKQCHGARRQTVCFILLVNNKQSHRVIVELGGDLLHDGLTCSTSWAESSQTYHHTVGKGGNTIDIMYLGKGTDTRVKKILWRK